MKAKAKSQVRDAPDGVTARDWEWLQAEFPRIAQGGNVVAIRDLVSLKRGLRQKMASLRLGR